MEDIKSVLERIYPKASKIEYSSKKGKLNVNLSYVNKYECSCPDLGTSLGMFLAMLMCHCFLSIPALCFIPSPVWANIVFGLVSIFVGVGSCCIDQYMTETDRIFILVINFIIMLLIILIVWHIEINHPAMSQNIPKFFNFLCKFKF